MKLQPIDHSVLGRLVPDQWGRNLICFRQISGWNVFAPDDVSRQSSLLSPSERKLVESWNTSPDKLVPRCRDSGIHASLRGLGVFEISYGNLPTAEQVAAWQYFHSNESQICSNVWNVLLRYYQLERTRDPDWFDQCDCPELGTVAELGPLATLDGVSFSNQSCEGLSIMRLSWDVDWDMEHGLSIFVWKDQVIGMNLESESDILISKLCEAYAWNSSNMTPLELEYQDRVRQALLSQRRGEDVASEFSDTD